MKWIIKVNILIVSRRKLMATSLKRLTRDMQPNRMLVNRISWTERKSSYWAIWSQYKLYMSKIMILESLNLRIYRTPLRITMIKVKIKMEVVRMRRGSFLKCVIVYNRIRQGLMDTLEECLVLKMCLCNLIIRLSSYRKMLSCSN